MAPLVRISGKWEDSSNIRKKNKEDKTGEEDRGKERKQRVEKLWNIDLGVWFSV